MVTGADAVVSPASAPETTSMLFLRIKTAATADAAHSLVGRRRRRERKRKREGERSQNSTDNEMIADQVWMRRDILINFES